MNKLLISFCLVCALFAQEQNGTLTEALYLSPHGLSRQRQVHDSIPNVVNKLHVDSVEHFSGEAKYILSNITVELDYLDAKQKIEVVESDEVEVSGGMFDFLFNFNFTKGPISGYGHGSVVSDSFKYVKTLVFGSSGHLEWTLIADPERSYANVTISKTDFKIKRIEPFDEQDTKVLESMIAGTVSEISPGSVYQLVLDKFNGAMPYVLNNTLNHESLSPEVDYSYHSASKGELNLTLLHELYKFKIDATDGFSIKFQTKIKGEEDPICDAALPEQHLSFDFYGGTQDIMLNCLFEEVVGYMQKKGWLDITLDSSWECNAFQFYAGDLYELIPNLYLKVNPRELLTGECKASSNDLSLEQSRQFLANSFLLKATYNCVIRSRDKGAQPIDILKFKAETNTYLLLSLGKTMMDWEILDSDIKTIAFDPDSQFHVNDLNLALFKANEVTNQLKKLKVFGTGFPTFPRQFPKTEVQTNYTVFYDGSHTMLEII